MSHNETRKCQDVNPPLALKPGETPGCWTGKVHIDGPELTGFLWASARHDPDGIRIHLLSAPDLPGQNENPIIASGGIKTINGHTIATEAVWIVNEDITLLEPPTRPVTFLAKTIGEPRVKADARTTFPRNQALNDEELTSMLLWALEQIMRSPAWNTISQSTQTGPE